MKLISYKYRYLFTLLLSLLLFTTSCEEEDEQPTTLNPDLVTFTSSLSGDQMVPPATSKATGSFRGTYDPETKLLSYTITFAGIIPNAMHFHKGEAGEEGDMIIEILPEGAPYSSSNPYKSPVQGSTPALTAEQEADLLAGKWYLDIHSNANTGGELRGQIKR
ncbi:CHRD domain-containing protein [Pontibacter ruber]|uniref:CHRD domain-containing protein n=1 Tax=Pontibacter ruber TaxID=1343895 RepID=A0ABW5D217_9BACT|nr:CHRD domain-containing protein [Pontibacter ruber]